MDDWRTPHFANMFRPRIFDSDEVKKAFRALKHAYEGARRELKERGVEIIPY